MDSDTALKILARACVHGREQLAAEAAQPHVREASELVVTNPLLRLVSAEGLLMLVTSYFSYPKARPWLT